MKKLSFMLILVIAKSVFASPAVQKPQVVKIYSWFADDKSRLRTGSGVLLEKDGQYYVLSNSHTIFHGSRPSVYTTFDYWTNGKSIYYGELNPVAINIGYDLSLLRIVSPGFVRSPIAAQAIKVSSIHDSAAKLDAEIAKFPRAQFFMQGFSLSRTVNHVPVFHSVPASIREVKYDFSYLPFVSNFVLLNGHTEPGMSGGGLFNEAGELRGLLVAHHQLRSELGKTPDLADISTIIDTATIYGLALPLNTVSEWLAKVFSSESNYDLREDLSLQKVFIKAVSYDGLLFQENFCQTIKKDTRPIGGDVIGIGGESVSKGGDPVGIGGNGDNRKTNSEFCGIGVKRSSVASAWPYNKPSWFDNWAKDLKHKVDLGCKINVQKITKKEGERSPIKNLEHLLLAIDQEEGIPLYSFDSCDISLQDEQQNRLVELSKKIKPAAQKLSAFLLTELKNADDSMEKSELMKKFFRDLDVIAEDLTYHRLDLLSSERMSLVEASKPGSQGRKAWTIIFANENLSRQEYRNAQVLFAIIDELSRILQVPMEGDDN